MTETSHTRSRNASLGGLVLQLLVFAGILALSHVTNSAATNRLAWYVLGGVPIWFVVLLVFRQRELAALEALDLEELRREKRTRGGGEALFDEAGAGGLGFRVAEARLHWMQRWLVPGFGLGTAVYLAVMGILLWRRLAVTRLVGGVETEGLAIGGEGWPELASVPVAMVILAVVMLLTFLLSRYTSGMARVGEWQFLRGCGSYMLASSLATVVLLVCLGVYQYARVATWEQTLAYIIPVMMVVLAIEILINFVLDIYRPRTPDVEPRACFDSRLLGLIAEPGGIAHSIAEAINYQFGFQVSQTWFYQLLHRTFAWLLLAGALSLWLLTCIVVVQPYEHVIIERWGRQINAGSPLGPGLHWKRPWPWEIARVYNTGQLHQISVGFKKYDAVPEFEEDAGKTVLLWTDPKHLGQEHFDFMICPAEREKGEEGPEPPAEEVTAREGETQVKHTPVHLLRMNVAVQYRIEPEKLHLYTNAMKDPHGLMRFVAWEQLGRYMASTTADRLLGVELGEIGDVLRERITRRMKDFGLDVIYVGVTNVHPEKTVAEAFRKVVEAEQERVAAIREALVGENERLSKVAGDERRARALARAVEQSRKASEQVNRSEKTLSNLDPAVVAEYQTRLAELELAFQAQVHSKAVLAQARDEQRRVELDFELGLGQTADRLERAAQTVDQAEAEQRAAAAALEESVAPVRRDAAGRLSAEQVDALIHGSESRVARTYWEQRLTAEFTLARLEGEAAALLAQAFADRWAKEMKAARAFTQMQNEREAHEAAPEVYRTRRLIEVLVDGLKQARKFFLAFDPGERLLRVRFLTDDSMRLDLTEVSPPGEQ